MTPAVRPGTVLTIVVPGDLPRELSPNASRSVHWGTKTKVRNEIKRSAFYAIKEAIMTWSATHGDFVPLSGHVDVQIGIWWGKGRKIMDADNALASCKAVIDQLTEAGAIVDDKQCRYPPIVQKRDPTGVGFIEIVVREAS